MKIGKKILATVTVIGVFLLGMTVFSARTQEDRTSSSLGSPLVVIMKEGRPALTIFHDVELRLRKDGVVTWKYVAIPPEIEELMKQQRMPLEPEEKVNSDDLWTDEP